MRPLAYIFPAILLVACSADGGAVPAAESGGAAAAAQAPASRKGLPFQVQPVATFKEPWAMTFLPGNAGALVTEKPGRLIWWANGRSASVAGVPKVDYGGQGGLGDVILHPNFASNNLVY
ncbi:MAG TPA: PQQ-dependent sugar dehydrogenase, partial [Allosphingosinicella sp.]|nr:PQQ-dependent sugar dehydrogenase [Allosphingosinicella sp.]